MDDKEFQRLLNTVGKSLYRIREDADVSRERLQQKTGIHRNTIFNYENGAASPTLRIIAVLADALGYKVSIGFSKKEE